MRLPPPFPFANDNHFNDFNIMAPSNECSKMDNNMHNTSSGSNSSTLLDLSHFDTLPMPAADRPTALYNNINNTNNESFSKAVGGHLKPRPVTARQLSTQMSVNTSRNLAENLHSLTDIFSRMDNFSNSSVGTSLVSSLDSCDDPLSSGPSSATPSECGGNNGSNNKNKLKTVLCKYYLAGDCSRGDKCSFAHGREDLREVDYEQQEQESVAAVSSASSVVSAKADFASTTASSSSASETGANPNRKTKLCRNLFEDGLCPFSVNCNFAHSLDELKHTPGHVKHNNKNSSSSKPVDQHRRGSKNWSVVDAAESKAAVVATVPAVNDPKLYKTRMCKHYVKTGKCWLQADCRFAHGDDELRGEQEAARAAKAQHHQ